MQKMSGEQRFSFLRLFAYWKATPSWPRRVFCESRVSKYLNACPWTVWPITAFFLVSYFLIMDFILFRRYASINLVHDSKGGQPGEIYLPFTHLSVKAILNDHPSQFIIAPTAEYFDMITHFSSIFWFITPNMISIAHLCIGFIGGKFVASDNLQDRRIGVLLFLYRTWVDAFDGVVFRNQQGHHLRYHSDHATMGYAIDAGCDTLGGVLLCFAIYFYLSKKFVTDKELLPFCFRGCDFEHSEALPLTNGHIISSPVQKTKSWSGWFAFWSAFSIGMCLAISGKCWDQVVEDYTNAFQVQLPEIMLNAKQYQFAHSQLTLTLFQLWRVFGGQSVLNYILLAVYLDKVVVFQKGLQYVFIAIALVLYTVTAVHIQIIRDTLHL